MEVVTDPYGKDPRRHPALIVRSAKPFNAETPKQILGEQLHTPNELFFVRHHLPVPHIKPEEYLLEVKGERHGPPVPCAHYRQGRLIPFPVRKQKARCSMPHVTEVPFEAICEPAARLVRIWSVRGC